MTQLPGCGQKLPIYQLKCLKTQRKWHIITVKNEKKSRNVVKLMGKQINNVNSSRNAQKAGSKQSNWSRKNYEKMQKFFALETKKLKKMIT